MVYITSDLYILNIQQMIHMKIQTSKRNEHSNHPRIICKCLGVGKQNDMEIFATKNRKFEIHKRKNKKKINKIN